MIKKRNTCEEQNPDKKHRTLNKAKKKLAARKRAFAERSVGGHLCHMPGSMKMR